MKRLANKALLLFFLSLISIASLKGQSLGELLEALPHDQMPIDAVRSSLVEFLTKEAAMDANNKLHLTIPIARDSIVLQETDRLNYCRLKGGSSVQEFMRVPYKREYVLLVSTTTQKPFTCSVLRCYNRKGEEILQEANIFLPNKMDFVTQPNPREVEIVKELAPIIRFIPQTVSLEYRLNLQSAPTEEWRISLKPKFRERPIRYQWKKNKGFVPIKS